MSSAKRQRQRQRAAAGRGKPKIIANTREMLSMAEVGFAEATGKDPRKRRAGLMNLCTYGQAVLATIQTMRNTDPNFQAWWEAKSNEIGADPLMSHFKYLREKVGHEGSLETTNRTIVGAHGPVDMGALWRELRKHAPPGTTRIFLGDEIGGDGYEVAGVGKVYFTLPDSFDVKSTLELPDLPVQHDGQTITDASIANLGTLYLDSLRTLVSEFVGKFALSPPDVP